MVMFFVGRLNTSLKVILTFCVSYILFSPIYTYLLKVSKHFSSDFLSVLLLSSVFTALSSVVTNFVKSPSSRAISLLLISFDQVSLSAASAGATKTDTPTSRENNRCRQYADIKRCRLANIVPMGRNQQRVRNFAGPGACLCSFPS